MDRLSNLPFPAYTYVPGKTPHPVSDPAGHRYQRPEPHVEAFVPDRWEDCEHYRFGIDLFNAGYFWEAHEQWEAVWHAVGRHGYIADFLKGLIKLAAAGVKMLEGRPNGVARHATRATELFQSAAAGRRSVSCTTESMCGMSLQQLACEASRIAELPDLNSIGLRLGALLPSSLERSAGTRCEES